MTCKRTVLPASYVLIRAQSSSRLGVYFNNKWGLIETTLMKRLYTLFAVNLATQMLFLTMHLIQYPKTKEMPHSGLMESYVGRSLTVAYRAASRNLSHKRHFL